MNAASVIRTEGLTRRFGDLVAVDRLDLEVARGEIFGCLGPNGSGKSTLMRMLLGLMKPSGGRATVLGHAIPQQAERLRPAVGYMTQRFSLYEELSVEENLGFCAEIFGLGARDRRERVAESIAEAGLEPYRKVRAAALSGGWKQRLALAASTLHRPELLVLDEPTAGVDPQSRRQFWERLFELAGSGTTVLVSTHYMDEAVRCHRLCFLNEGRRAALGTPADLVEPLRGRCVDLELPEAEQAVAHLSGGPWVTSPTQLGDCVHVLLRPEAPAASEAAPALARDLEAQGLGPVHASASRPTLEDVFVAILAGEQLDA